MDALTRPNHQRRGPMAGRPYQRDPPVHRGGPAFDDQHTLDHLGRYDGGFS